MIWCLREDIGDAYGVRLIDQPAPPGTNDSATDLVVLRDATGIHVALRQINVASGAGPQILQTLDLPSGTYNQIVLKLSYAHDSFVNSTAGGKVTASFDVLNNGSFVSSNSFSSQGTIFVGEDFTRGAAAWAVNPGRDGRFQAGWHLRHSDHRPGRPVALFPG